MIKRELQEKAEKLVRKIVGGTFGQKMDGKVIATAAAKVARAVPSTNRGNYSDKPQISSRDHT